MIDLKDARMLVTYVQEEDRPQTLEKKQNRNIINLSLTFLEYIFLIFARQGMEMLLQNEKTDFFIFKINHEVTDKFNFWLTKKICYNPPLKVANLLDLITSIHKKVVNVFNWDFTFRENTYRNYAVQLAELDRDKDSMSKLILKYHHPRNLLAIMEVCEKWKKPCLPIDYLLQQNPLRLDEFSLFDSEEDLKDEKALVKNLRFKARQKEYQSSNSKVFLLKDIELMMKITPIVDLNNPQIEWAGRTFTNFSEILNF